MHNYKLLKVDLKLFDGAAGAPAAGGECAQATEGALPKAEVKGRSGSSRRSKAGAFDNVVFGKQDAAAGTADGSAAGSNNATGKGEVNAGTAGRESPLGGTSGISTTSDSLEAKRQEFQKLIDGEYKDQYTEMFQNAFNRRFKEVKGMEDSLNAQKPILDMLMQRYKIGDGDMAKLQTAIEQDSTYWEDAAEEAGLTVEQYKAMQKLERENAELKAMRQRQAADQQAQQKLNQWHAESEEVKKIYPTFDFRAEAADRNFLGMLKAGLSVQQAYELKHMDEIKANAAKVAAQTAGQQMAARIQTKASRPAENGTSSQSAVIVKSDVHNLTRAERAEIAKRAARGESIKF